MDYHSPYFFGYLLGLIHLLGIVAALHALFTVRTAQGAIAWAMPLLFIPYLTLIPYLIFGARSFYAYIKARRQANQEMHVAMANLNWRPWVEEALTARESESYAALRAMPKLGRMPCLANNQVKLLINGKATFDAIFAAIEKHAMWYWCSSSSFMTTPSARHCSNFATQSRRRRAGVRAV